MGVEWNPSGLIVELKIYTEQPSGCLLDSRAMALPPPALSTIPTPAGRENIRLPAYLLGKGLVRIMQG